MARFEFAAGNVYNALFNKIKGSLVSDGGKNDKAQIYVTLRKTAS